LIFRRNICIWLNCTLTNRNYFVWSWKFIHFILSWLLYNFLMFRLFLGWDLNWPRLNFRTVLNRSLIRLNYSLLRWYVLIIILNWLCISTCQWWHISFLILRETSFDLRRYRNLLLICSNLAIGRYLRLVW
jgi:hypothetical protein